MEEFMTAAVTSRWQKVTHFLKTKPIVAIAVAAILAQVVTTSVYAATTDTVELTINHQKTTINTHADKVAEVLKEYGVTVEKYDYLNTSIDTPVTDNMSIVWEPAVKIILTIDGVETEKWTTEDSVQAFLSAESIQVTEFDKIDPVVTSNVTADMNISIKKAFAVTINNGGVPASVNTTSATVSDLLQEQAIELGTADRVEPELTAPLSGGSVVNVIRVEKTTEAVESTVPFENVDQADASLEEGTKKVLTDGQNGVIQSTNEVVKENGVIVSTSLLSQTVIQEKVDQVTAVGAMKKATEPSTPKTAKAKNPAATVSTPPATGGNRSAVVSYSKQFIGIPYRAAGSTPAGFDCSGFVMYCYKNSLGISVPRSASDYASFGTSVSNLVPGDFVLFRTGNRISHVGIYIGGNQFISSTSSRGIKIDSLSDSYWGPKYAGARRI